MKKVLVHETIYKIKTEMKGMYMNSIHYNIMQCYNITWATAKGIHIVFSKITFTKSVTFEF